MIEFTPITIAASAAAALIVLMLIILVRRRRKPAAKGGGVTLVLMRGQTPLGDMIEDAQFENGQFVLYPKSRNPHLILYDGRYVRKTPDGRAFLFYDTESKSVVGYAGECSNDDDVTLVFHDGTARDVSAEEAARYIETEQPEGKASVYRKHPALWRRMNGTRLYSEKETMDWDNIQSIQATWLAILQQYMPVISIVTLVLLGMIGAVVVF